MPVQLSRTKKDAILNWYMLEPKNGRGYLLPGRCQAAAAQFHCTIQTLRKTIKNFKDGNVPLVVGQPQHVIAPRGHPVSQLTDNAIIAMYEVAQQHIDNQIRCTDRRLKRGMADLGFHFCLSTIQHWRKSRPQLCQIIGISWPRYWNP